MQARWGSHGHYEIIALAPASPQELFYLTITAFNLSETYRTPVLVMTDEVTGHLSERVIIPDAGAIKLHSRPAPKGRKDRFKAFQPGPNGVAPMAIAGEAHPPAGRTCWFGPCASNGVGLPQKGRRKQSGRYFTLCAPLVPPGRP